MRDLLQRIRARVDRLASGVECDGPHARRKSASCSTATPSPTGRPSEAATCGRCVAELEITTSSTFGISTSLSDRRCISVNSRSSGRYIGRTI